MNRCRNETECCRKCSFLEVEERLAAAEYLVGDTFWYGDIAYTPCRYYCGRFESDRACTACDGRELIAARAKEIFERAQMGQPYERKGWVCHGL